MDDLRGFESRQAHDFDKGRERIISTILVCSSHFLSCLVKEKQFSFRMNHSPC